MLLANRLEVPAEIQAILWDMDGVLIDSLTFDYDVCNRLLAKHAGAQYHVSRETIRLNFPFDLPEFWRRLLSATGMDSAAAANADLVESLVNDHQHERISASFEVNPGVLDVLRAATDAGVKMAVVSNNPAAEIAKIVERLELSGYFAEVVGNDGPGINKKPAPDAYLLAAQRLACQPPACLVVEDSLIGAKAGRTAGCRTVGIATGATNLAELEACSDIDVSYSSFERENTCQLDVGDVKVKSIQTPNDFVSHMIEHLAWRLGLSIDLRWNNNDWEALGSFIGTELTNNTPVAEAGAAFSMIDDGSAEVLATRSTSPAVNFTGTNELDLNWFQALRCEQISDGTPLVRLLNGLAHACGIRFEILVGSLEDPHHTWEGIFRTVGIAMRQIYFEHEEQTKPVAAAPAGDSSAHGWFVGEVKDSQVEVRRTTAESSVRVAVNAAGSNPSKFVAHVAESIQVRGLADMIERFASSAQMSIDAEFTSLELSSSHVVAEDTGMVLGRALKQLLVERMNSRGINGAGSSVTDATALSEPLHVAISFEGRNSVNIVPIRMSRAQLQRRMLVGHTLSNGLFSEDLDDFLYGLAQGMSSTITVHVHEVNDPEQAWQQMFVALGKAWTQAFAVNPTRLGVPPGVKATLS